MVRVRISALAASVVLSALTSLATVAVVPAGAAHAAAPTPQECAESLDCGLEEIQLMSMSDRLDLVRAMESGPVADYLGDGVDAGRWRNIEGIVRLFRDESLGARGNWVSYVDAGILEGLERGIGLATGATTATGGNPGTRLWADYLTRLHAGSLTTRAAHDRAWSLAEQASTDHGIEVAEQTYGEQPTATMNRFFQLSQVYRYLLRNRPAAADLLTSLGGLSPQQREDFYDWATDVTDAEAGRTGAEAMWSLAEADPAGSGFTLAQVFQAYFEEMYPAYVAATR